MKYLIALIALALPAYLIRFNFCGIPTTLLELLIYAVFLIGFIRLGYTHLLSCKNRVWLPVGLLLLAAVISVIVLPEKTVALGQLKAFFIDPVLVFFMVVCYLQPKDIRWPIYGLTLSGLAVSLYSIWQNSQQIITADGRVIGIFGYSPNFVALFLAPVTVLLIAYGVTLIASKKWIRAIPFGLVALINLYGIYLSGSRAGLLATAAGAFFFLILHFWPKIWTKLAYKIGLIVLIVALVLAAWLSFRPNFNATSGRVVSSANVRWQIWQASLELAAQHPVFGVGLGNFQNAFTKLTAGRVNFNEYIIPEAASPHNIFLMFYLGLGILGVLGFLWLLIIFYQTGFKNSHSDWSKILLSGMTALLLQGLVDAAYFKNDLSLLFWLVLGLMLAVKGEKK